MITHLSNKELIRKAEDGGDELSRELADRLERQQDTLNQSAIDTAVQQGHDSCKDEMQDDIEAAEFEAKSECSRAMMDILEGAATTPLEKLRALDDLARSLK